MSLPKIKVLHIVPALRVGGAERLLVDLVSGLDRSRFEAVVLLFDRAVATEEPWRKQLTSAGIRIIEVYENKPLAKLPLIGGLLRSLRIFLRVKKVVRREKPQLIHAHLFGDFYGRLVGLATGIPVISTEQNVNVHEPAILRFVKRMTAARIAMTVAVSKAVRSDIIKRYDVPEEKTTIIPNGIDIERFVAQRTDRSYTPSSTVVFGALARLDPQKGLDTLIEAMALVQVKDPNIRVRVAGEGMLRPELETHIRKLSLQETIQLIGIVTDTPAFLAEVDAFVMPSRWEGFGIAAVEAGAAGLPVIASRVDGLKEIIEDKVSGVLVEPNDSKELADALLTMAVKVRSGSAQRYGMALRHSVRERFSIQAIVTAYEELYEQHIVSMSQSKEFSDKPISVVHVLPRLTSGGAEMMAVELALKSSSLLRTWFVSLKKPDASGLLLEQRLQRAGIPVYVIGQNFAGDPRVVFRLAALFVQHAPDLIHTHLFGGELYGSLAARLARISSVIATVHSTNLHESLIRSIARKIYTPLIKRFIAVSPAVAAQVIQSGICKAEKVSVIVNGIDTERFRPEAKAKTPFFMVGTVGRLEPEKDQETLIRAIDRLDRLPRLRCSIGGNGSLYRRLEDEIDARDLNHRVHVAGQIADVPDFLKSLDVFILPSLWEGLPMVVLEAGACGLPVIASNIPALEGLIKDEENGFLFNPGDEEELAKKIARLHDDTELRELFGQRLHAMIVARYDIRIMAKAYEEAYRNVIFV